MSGFLFVFLGGGLGAVLRYGIGLIPCRGDFPLLTLIINLLGAVLIGFVSGLAGRKGLSQNSVLFLKTGLCGGFTTFSTFSLESYNLFRAGQTGWAVLYIVLSVGLCLAGIAAGMSLSRRVG